VEQFAADVALVSVELTRKMAGLKWTPIVGPLAPAS
jgi:hypothetical protein